MLSHRNGDFILFLKLFKTFFFSLLHDILLSDLDRDLLHANWFTKIWLTIYIRVGNFVNNINDEITVVPCTFYGVTKGFTFYTRKALCRLNYIHVQIPVY